MKPKVSIIIPVYNGSNYLKEAIDSAIAQTYDNVEILVINDGSTDDGATEKIAKSYGEKIRYFKKKNGGVATALNLGIEKMTGEYFSWLSHDDMYYPEKIEKQIELLSKLDNNVVVVADWTIVNKHNKKIKQCILDDRLETIPRCFLAFDRKTWLNGCAMLIHKSIFDKVGKFNIDLKTTQDYELYNRMINFGVSFRIIHQPLIYSRSHTEQGSMSDPAAKDNSDRIHSSIVSNLKSDDIDAYFNGNHHELNLTYDIFWKIGFKRTSAQIARCFIRNFLDNNNERLIHDFLNDKLIISDLTKNENDINRYIKILKNNGGKKRLMFCSGHWLTGGMERVLSNLFHQLNNYELFLITPFDGRKSCIDIPDYVTHIRMPDELFAENFDTVVLSYALMFDVDIVIGFMNLFDKQLDLYGYCNDVGIKTVASNHEYYFYPYKSPYISHQRIAERRLSVFKEVDAVLWLTGFSTAVYNQYNNNGYLIANPNTFSVQSKPLLKNEKDEKIIICVGRFNDYIKRVDRMLACFALVQEREPESKLMLVGPCDREKTIAPNEDITIDELIVKYKIDIDRIIFVGETNEVQKYYSRASLILLTSNNEGFGMVLNEAACFGVPIVCNEIPGIEDLVTNGLNGFVVKQDDISTMADRVYDILTNDKLRNEMSRRAIENVKRFEAKVIGDKWKYLFESMLYSNSQEETKVLLDKELSFNIDDYNKFANIIANELNDIFFNIVRPKNKLVNQYGNGLISYWNRLSEAIRYDGFQGAFRRIIIKIYKKIIQT